MNKKPVVKSIISAAFLVLALVFIGIVGVGFSMGNYVQMDIQQKILVTLDQGVDLLLAIVFMLLALYFK